MVTADCKLLLLEVSRKVKRTQRIICEELLVQLNFFGSAFFSCPPTPLIFLLHSPMSSLPPPCSLTHQANTNPALSLDNAVLEDLLPKVVDGALELVLATQGPDRAATATDAELLAALPGRWSLLVDEASGFEFKR